MPDQKQKRLPGRAPPERASECLVRRRLCRKWARGIVVVNPRSIHPPRRELPVRTIPRSPKRDGEGSRVSPSYLIEVFTVNRKHDVDHEKRLKECANLT